MVKKEYTKPELEQIVAITEGLLSGSNYEVLEEFADEELPVMVPKHRLNYNWDEE